MKPIAVFFHAAFYRDPVTPFPMAIPIVWETMQLFKNSGLLEASSFFLAGINGGEESKAAADSVFPPKVTQKYHGLEYKNENGTIVELQNWVKDHPGWLVFYGHGKGLSHAPGSDYGENVSGPWRRTMAKHLITEWPKCVADLEAGHDIACCHWMRNMADGSQNIPCGNMTWVTSDYARKLPSIFDRERIKTSGIAALESRYEAECVFGFGPEPKVKEYLPQGGDGVP